MLSARFEENSIVPPQGQRKDCIPMKRDIDLSDESIAGRCACCTIYLGSSTSEIERQMTWNNCSSIHLLVSFLRET